MLRQCMMEQVPSYSASSMPFFSPSTVTITFITSAFPLKQRSSLRRRHRSVQCTQTPPRPRISKPPVKIIPPNDTPIPSPSSTSSSSSSPSAATSFLLLNTATIIWSTQHSLIKLSLSTTPPSTLTFSRFFLATLISLPFLPRSTKAWFHSLEQGLYLFLGFALQSVALTSTTASRSAFLLYLNVKLVPLFSYLLYKRIPTTQTILSAAFALLGTAILSWDGSAPTIGDFWSIAAAAASAMFILRLETAAKSAPASQISAGAVATVAALSFVWTMFSGNHEIIPTDVSAWAVVVYLGVVATALGNWLQTVAQAGVSAERAAIVYALDPVYGALVAYWVLGERLGSWGWVGGGIVALAAIWSALEGSVTSNRDGDGGKQERKEGLLRDEEAPGED